MNLSQAVQIGCKGTVAVVVECRSRGSRTGWGALCKGTGWLTPVQSVHKSAPFFHVVSCGHVALPHEFRELYEPHTGVLDEFGKEETRIRVQVRGDRGEVLADIAALPETFASSDLADDIAVLHVGRHDAKLLQEAQGEAGGPLVLLPSPSLASPGDLVSFPSYSLLTGSDVGTVDCRILDRDYDAIMGDMAARRLGGSPLSPDAPFSMVPTLHHGVVDVTTSSMLAVRCSPAVASANSGAPLISRCGGFVLGMLCRVGVSSRPEERDKASYLYRARREEFAYLDSLGGAGAEAAFFTPVSKLRSFLRQVEKSLLR